MIGVLLINSRQQLCFVAARDAGSITGFRYCMGPRLLMVATCDGSEQMVTAEMPEPVHAALARGGKLLVVETDPADVRQATYEQSIPVLCAP